MFHHDNYRPGQRNWILSGDRFNLDCSIVIEKFNQPVNYLKVHNIWCIASLFVTRALRFIVDGW